MHMSAKAKRGWLIGTIAVCLCAAVLLGGWLVWQNRRSAQPHGIEEARLVFQEGVAGHD